jgi:hypothetical protein
MFMRAAGAAGLTLTGRSAFAASDRPVETLLSVLENARRERVLPTLAQMIRAGLRYEDLLEALSLAAVRNVQPYPDVGYKYHSVMVLRSIHLTTEHLPPTDKWLPILWATDYFKRSQAEERETTGWHVPAKRASTFVTAQAARRALVDALDKWDRDAADAAVVSLAQLVRPEEIFSLLFSYGARDLRAIGHKAITVSNAHSLVTVLGSANAEYVLRSTVAALQNSDAGPNPASRDLEPDRPWRNNQRQLRAIPPSWKQGRNDAGARTELRAALYHVSEDEAGAVVANLLRQGISPEAIWPVLFDTAAELLLREPGIVPLHAQTTANALHYAYRTSSSEQTQQLLLLQCAAFIAMFRRIVGATQSDLSLESLQPLQPDHKGNDAIDEMFSDVSAGRRLRAANKSLGFLQGGGDAAALIAAARHHLVYYVDEAHDYKFAEALFDNHSQLAHPAWRNRFLSAGMAYFKAPAKRRNPVVEEVQAMLSP